MIGPSQRPLPNNTHHSQLTDIHAAGGIRIRSPSKRTAADPRLGAATWLDELSMGQRDPLVWGLVVFLSRSGEGCHEKNAIPLWKEDLIPWRLMFVRKMSSFPKIVSPVEREILSLRV